jgi:hypothetical protein
VPVVGVAHADSTDDQFVATLSSQGIPGDRGALISTAHQFCDAQHLPRIGIGLPSPYTMQILNLRNQLVGSRVAATADGPTRARRDRSVLP